MENMERFVPLYAIAYAILNGMENLRFDKEVLRFSFLWVKSIKEMENVSLRVPIRYRNTCKRLGELEIALETLALRVFL